MDSLAFTGPWRSCFFVSVFPFGSLTSTDVLICIQFVSGVSCSDGTDRRSSVGSVGQTEPRELFRQSILLKFRIFAFATFVCEWPVG